MGIGHKARSASLTQTRLVGMRVQTSLNGRPIPIVYGAHRLPANLIWYGDFKSVTQQQQQGGKGIVGGGGKGSSKSYVYYAAVAAALCEGPIAGLGNVWDSQGQLALITTSQNYTVPGGGGSFPVTPPAGGTHRIDMGVGRADAYSVGANDYGDIPRTLTGTQQTPMAPVGSAPGAGQYTQSGGTYTFGAADAGKVMTITYTYSVPNSGGNGVPTTTLSLTLFTGTRPQTAWSYLTSAHTSQALAYGGLAYVCNSSLFLGSSGQLPNLSYEVLGFLPFGAGIPDCNPSAAIQDFLTSSVYGAGFNPSLIASWTNYSNYCVANGLFLSLALDQHETAASIIQRIMSITNSECVWTGSTLKAIPYGDTTVVGNGVTFTPNTTPWYDLGEDDFISPDQGEPVQLKIGTVIDANNSVTVEYADRSNQYNASLVEAKDDASINLYGLRPADPESWHEITTQKVAALAADLLLRRKVYVRNVYSFTVGWRYAVLEPMDMVTITDATLGLNKAPVRIISISEDDKGNLSIEAEEFPWGTATPTLYPKESNAGFTPASVADPGNVNAPIIVEANNRASGQTGYQLWFGVSGANANWGGCTVWMSLDNATYKQIGKVYGASRMGVLTAALASAADPDTTNTLAVDLTQSGGKLLSGTAADADGDRTLCLVDNELISYQTATLTSAFHYNLTTRLRRGQLTSAIAAHSIGAPFLRIDDAVFKYQFDPLLIGSTVYFKFTSFNTAQNMEQPLSSATAYSFAIVGNFKGVVDLAVGMLNGSTPLNRQASIASSGALSAFSYSATTTSLTWTWAAFTIYFPDGSTLAVAASTGGTQVAFASLTASTTYHFGIYVDLAGTVHVLMSDVSGGISKGSLGWQVQTINADGHAVITVDATAATPASGGGGGVPPGGSTCPADDEPIETREFGFVPAVEVKAHMHVRGGDGNWKEVEEAYSVEGWLQHVWFDGDDVHHVDIDHRWLRSEGDFRADLDSERDWKLQRDLIPGDVVKGADEKLYPVMRISERHRGSYRKIRVNPGENGDRSLRMGKAVTHNFITA